MKSVLNYKSTSGIRLLDSTEYINSVSNYHLIVIILHCILKYNNNSNGIRFTSYLNFRKSAWTDKTTVIIYSLFDHILHIRLQYYY